MANPTLNSALSQLAKVQKARVAAQKRMAQQKESQAEQIDHVIHTGIQLGSAAAAGALDAYVDDTIAGVYPSELVGLGAGVLSLSGVLGVGTKGVRSGAVGALCWSSGHRAFRAVRGMSPDVSGHPVVGAINDAEENDLLAAMREEQDADYENAEAYVS